MKNKIIVLVFISAAIIAISAIPFAPQKVLAYHSADELDFFKTHMTPIAPGEYFLTPENCKGCHGFDTLGIANVDGNGQDVNLYDDWETSMM